MSVTTDINTKETVQNYKITTLKRALRDAKNQLARLEESISLTPSQLLARQERLKATKARIALLEQGIEENSWVRPDRATIMALTELDFAVTQNRLRSGIAEGSLTRAKIAERPEAAKAAQADLDKYTVKVEESYKKYHAALCKLGLDAKSLQNWDEVKSELVKKYDVYPA